MILTVLSQWTTDKRWCHPDVVLYIPLDKAHLFPNITSCSGSLTHIDLITLSECITSFELKKRSLDLFKHCINQNLFVPLYQTMTLLLLHGRFVVECIWTVPVSSFTCGMSFSPDLHQQWLAGHAFARCNCALTYFTNIATIRFPTLAAWDSS